MSTSQTKYQQFHVTTNEALRDILIALFSNLDFDSFEETDSGFVAYMEERILNEQVLSELRAMQDNFAFEFTQTPLEDKNWNAVWESNFAPIQIDEFCGIRADFHPPFEQVQHELLINPKMAFGTGHHETTFMMIQCMEKLNFEQKSVLDYGCGTGILAILAQKLGATDIKGVDIEKPAVENSLENARLNETAGIDFYEGTLESVPSQLYDIILANINRNVILQSIPALYQQLENKGELLVSGILSADRSKVIDLATKTGFKLTQQLERGEWCCFRFKK